MLLDKQKARKERAAGVGVSSSQLTRLHAALHFLADHPVIAGDTPGLLFTMNSLLNLCFHLHLVIAHLSDINNLRELYHTTPHDQIATPDLSVQWNLILYMQPWMIIRVVVMRDSADTVSHADAYELQGGRFSGHAAVVAEGRELQVPGRHVTARLYVDAEDFVAEHCFYVLASHANYIPGKSLTISFPFPDHFWMLQLIHNNHSDLSPLMDACLL